LDSTLVDVRPFHRGAEADLFLARIGPWKAVVKRRVRKNYRISELDYRIRRERTIREVGALSDAKKAGVRAPSILEVDLEAFSIAMSYVEGDVARIRLDSMSDNESRETLTEIGRQIGALHEFGLVHGDMTTSNIILSKDTLPFILDFGMSAHSTDAEDRGTDLHLLQRSIFTSHTLDAKRSERIIHQGYIERLGNRQAGLSIRKQREIARRGRYFAIR